MLSRAQLEAVRMSIDASMLPASIVRYGRQRVMWAERIGGQHALGGLPAMTAGQRKFVPGVCHQVKVLQGNACTLVATRLLPLHTGLRG